MAQTKNRLIRMVSLALFFIMCFAAMIGIMFKTNVAYAASDKVAEFHFWQIGKGSGTRTDNGVGFQYSGIKANTDSNITIGAGTSVVITVSESAINDNGITSGAFYIYAAGITYTWTRGSTTLKSGTISQFVNIGETSIAGSGNLVLTLTNSTGSDVKGVHFESPNYALYAAPKRSVSITAGTGVKSVYMSTSSTATSGGSSGTEYADGTTVYGFAKLDKGYSAKSGWTLVSGTANAENAIYRVGSKTISKSQKSFGTISADAINYSITYTLNGGTLPSGYPSSYNITTNTFTLSNPTRTGYTFTGWTGSNGTTKQTSVSITKGSTGNKSYTANWTANQYNITYKDQGNAAFSGTHASGYPTKHTYGTATALKGASKDYYRFDGWFTNQNCTGSAITSIGATAFSADITLYAKWTPLTFTVTFDQQNGTGGTSSVIATSGLAMPSATMPTRTGYTFGGYFDGTNGNGTQYYSATGSSVTNWNKEANTTLYAYWIPIPATAPTVTSQPQGFDANYGDGGTLTASASVESGHTIDGYQWYLSSTGSTSNGSPIASATAATLTIPATQNAGTYYYYCVVTSKRTDNGTTATTATDVVMVKLAKINSVLTNAPVGIEELLYTAEAQALVAAGTAEGGTVWYKLGSGDYTTTIPSATLVDTYTVFYKVVGDQNHYDIAESSIQIKIAEVDKTALEAAISAANDYVAEISEDYSDLAAILALAVDDANTVYTNKNVTVTQVANKTDELLGKLGEVKASVTMEKINAIGEVEYTPECEEKINAARETYDALTDAQKELVTNYETLTAAESDYADLEAANAVDELINAIGEVEYTAECEEKINAAREAYDALTDARKELVTNYETLTTAESDYADLEAANTVADLFDAIGTVEYTPESRAKINAAGRAYKELTDVQKALVPNLGTLITARSVYAALKADQDAVDNVTSLINAIGTVKYTAKSKAKIDAAREAYDALTDEQKARITNYKGLTDAEAAYAALEANREAIDNVTNLIDAIGTVEYTAESKAKIDAARAAYNALTAEQKALVPNYKALTDAEAAYAALKANHEAIDNVTNLIDAIGTVEYTAESKAKIDAAREAYDALTASQKALVPNYKALTDAEAAYAALKADKDAADRATALIDAIGTVEYTTESKAKIGAARTAYNALTASQKAFVTNYKALTDAEAAYAALKADKDAADRATALINAIGTVEYTAESKAKIDAARTAYDALTAAQKALVKNVATLTTAESTYEALKADKDAVDNVIALIDTIGKVGHNAESKAKIEAAREAYDALTDEQKARITSLETLKAAEKTYAEQEETAAGTSKGISGGTIAIIVIVVVVVLVAGIIIFFIILKKKKSDEKSDEKSEKK